MELLKADVPQFHEKRRRRKRSGRNVRPKGAKIVAKVAENSEAKRRQDLTKNEAVGAKFLPKKIGRFHEKLATDRR